MDVMDDAVLASYARCLSADMLCAWARVSINDGTAAPTNFLEYAKELWIFWYGDEPTSLQPMLSTELQGQYHTQCMQSLTAGAVLMEV